jgi:hypothetical protein
LKNEHCQENIYRFAEAISNNANSYPSLSIS